MGKNLATKEDIKDITDKVESVKVQYSSQLESIKTAMRSKLYRHQVRYEKEFKILSNLTEKLVLKAKEDNVPTIEQCLVDYNPREMAFIPKGIFLYGDDNIETLIDYDYYIDIFPVTNKQYKQFCDDNKEWDVPWDKKTREYLKGMGEHPVVLVSHKDAVAFCEWRSQKEGKEYRLPTEKEWEKAARGPASSVYPWGDRFYAEKCNTSESRIGRPTPVTRYANGISPYGCYDMAGNVWEWTNSWLKKEMKMKVTRGGSWYFNSRNCRCAYREGHFPSVRSNDLGFRCARTLNLSFYPQKFRDIINLET